METSTKKEGNSGKSNTTIAANYEKYIEKLVLTILEFRRLGRTQSPQYASMLSTLQQKNAETPDIVQKIMTSAQMKHKLEHKRRGSMEKNGEKARKVPMEETRKEGMPSSASVNIGAIPSAMHPVFYPTANMQPGMMPPAGMTHIGGMAPPSGYFYQDPNHFSTQQMMHLKRQIDMYKSLTTSLAEKLKEDSSVVQVKTEPVAVKADVPLAFPGDEALDKIAKASNELAKHGGGEDSSAKISKSQEGLKISPALNVASKSKSSKWKRADRNLVYFGPTHHDGEQLPLPLEGFGPFNCGSYGILVDIDEAFQDADSTRSREECTRRKIAFLRKRGLEKSAVRLLSAQKDLRKQVMECYHNKLRVLGEPLAIDRLAYRRAKRQSHDEIRESDREERKKHIAKENKRRQKHQVYLRAVVAHSREFFSFHKNLQGNVVKAAKAVKAVIDQKIQRAEREEDRHEKLRLKALKANDMEAYSKLVAEAKNERLTYLLEQTDHYLDNIRNLVQQHRSTISLDADAEPKGGDYLGLLQHGDLPRQPAMLVGGDLKEYQLQGLQWMASLYDNKLNGILADEMGLGKTIQSIALITHVMEVKHNNGPFLVVVPLSTLSNWVNEFIKWSPDVILVVYKGVPQVRKDIYKEEMASCQFNVLLTTYEYIMKDKHVLRKYTWQYIIVDEGHRMKNAQSKFAQTLGTMYNSRNRILLTGTPLQNSLPELWALLNFLLPTIFKSVDTFEQWFSKPFAQFSGTGETNELSDEERMLIINRLHQVLRPFLLRRVKANVLDQLPQKVERVLKCELSGWQKILYKSIQDGGALLVDPSSGAKAVNGISRGLSNIIMQLRKVCNHPYLFQIDHGYSIDFTLVRSSGKFELLDRMLPKLKAGGHRVLMFSQMTQLMTILEDYFTWRGFRYLRLDGSTSSDEREQRMYQFNASDSPYFIFLLSTRAGGLGLNLATADTVILFDSDWNPAMDAQAQDRAHRIGQKNEVRVFRLCTNSPIEEKILSRATDKLNMNNLIVEAGKFNNRSKEAERKAMLESLIKLESEDAQEDGDGAFDDDQINEMMALNDEEYELYKRIDAERIRLETADWEEMKKHDSQLKGPLPSRLMSEKDAPEWLRQAERQKEDEILASTLGGSQSSEIGPRKRKEISYKPLSDTEFGKWVNGDEKPEGPPDTATVESKIPSSSTSSVAKRRRARKTKKKDQNPKRTAMLSAEYLKAYSAIVQATDETGRVRSLLFMEKPSRSIYPDYYQLIKEPIGFTTIKKRITKHQYRKHEEFDEDIYLLFNNAFTYNNPESWVYQDAIAMKEVYENHMQSIRCLDDNTPDPQDALPGSENIGSTSGHKKQKVELNV